MRIITPAIPDKRIVYAVTRSYYHCLAKHGVRIYEYTPGFCHAKMCVVDDVVATCGTINLDYRVSIIILKMAVSMPMVRQSKRPDRIWKP